MKNTEKQIVKQAEDYVTALYESSPNKNLLYHNIEHTQNVVNRANEIAAHYELSERDITVLNIAAWFHDTGHIYTDPMMHEEKSVEIMQDWMSNRLEYAEMAEDIAEVIMSTKFSTQPANMIQQIIKDADTYHFGLPGFKKIDKLLKKEMELRNLQTMLQDWKRNTLNLLESHQYFTSYCKNLLDMGKKDNIDRLHKKMRDQGNLNVSETMVPDDVDTGKKKNGAGGRSYITKGIQTMLRLTSENHMRLSEMADNKANILISVNAIIISVILSVLIRKIEVDTHLAIPTLIFLFSSLVTIVISILATRPKITKGSFTREDILNRRTNLLFFGNFFNTGLEEYKWGMATMMKDPNYLYGTLVDDIYYLGKVLGRKYKLVRIAYSVFMIGIIISALAFILAIAFNRSAPATVIMEGSGSPF